MTSLADLKLIDILPSSIADDPQFQALADAFDKQLKGILASIPAIEIYSRIDEHEEPLLSLLAWQFHVDHWDADWSVETKREAVRNSIKLHKKKGTPWAVEKAVEIATGERAEVLEWFDYDGDPYMFKVATETTANEEVYHSIVQAVMSAKNVRSHLDSVQFRSVLKKELYHGGKIRTGDVQHIPHRFGISAAPIQTYVGVGIRQADIVNIGIRDSKINVEPVELYTGIAMQQVDITTIPIREN